MRALPPSITPTICYRRVCLGGAALNRIIIVLDSELFLRTAILACEREGSLNFPPNRMGVMRMMTISTPHSGHADEAPAWCEVFGATT